MSNETPNNPAPPPVIVSFIDNPHAPDVYADEAVGFFVANGCIKITLASARSDYSTPTSRINRVVVGRLVMSADAAQGLAIGLYDFLKTRGLLREPLLGEDAKPN